MQYADVLYIIINNDDRDTFHYLALLGFNFGVFPWRWQSTVETWSQGDWFVICNLYVQSAVFIIGEMEKIIKLHQGMFCYCVSVGSRTDVFDVFVLSLP